MSTTETVMAANGARMLIDARLDAIDRALLGRVSRAERLDVVGEVDSRIDELLRARCGSSEPAREDVLAVLAQLDPPEAYLGDDDEPSPGARPASVSPSASVGRAGASSGIDRAWYGRASGVSGGIALLATLMAPVVYFLAVAMGSELVLFGGWAIAALTWLAAASTAVVLATVSRMTGVWSAVGLVLSVASVIPALGTIFMFFISYWI